ncbi:GntR family transcriptional regulator [Streptomyces klenkii]|uniref:GntR family transcriptional regulator n=1 Tax=Streptomyces klenkii TaxID=1420899 RepID=A0A3B0AB77_9ACTN|nr:GntR family transcriptional regulator [Streptomyces klenkii]RKN56756.1 GntR family transcriptional regulator [Streptomyces klenkii]
MPPDRADPRPISDTIAHEIRRLIMSGEWEPGRRLPTTEQLIRDFSTSNVTVQRALKKLKAEGFLVGRSGQGVYVRERAPMEIAPASLMAPVGPDQPYSWITEAAKRSQKGSNRILEVREIVPPRRVREVFGLPDDGVAVLRKRIGLLDSTPAELVWSYYPAELARGTRLADRRKIPGGSPALLEQMGYPTRGQDDVVGTRFATSEEFLLLELPGEIPLLDVFRVVYSDNRRPIEVTELVKPGHIYKASYAVTAG